MLAPVPTCVPPQLPVRHTHVAPVLSVPFTVSVELVPLQIADGVAVAPVGLLGCNVTFTATALLATDVPQVLVAVAV